jgi:hypothetical protein
VWLRPLSLNRGVAASGEYITRASRYQQSQVFLLDDEVYMEPTGLWTRGHSVARIALTSERAVLPMDLQAGPVRTAVRLESGSWSFEAALAPGERRRADVPAGGVLTVRTIGSFRPVDSDPTSRDGRALGVRLEFP